MKPTIGVLLIQLGTPAAPDKAHVRRYLAEFLNDPRVIDLPTPLRQGLVRGLILPFRPRYAAQAYQQIWRPDGSPLLVHSRQLTQALATELGNEYTVALGMRYGNPSIAAAIEELKSQHCQKWLILPLFPQYSSAATGSALQHMLAILQRQTDIPAMTIVNAFYDHPAYLTAWKSLIAEQHMTAEPEVWIFSYHGLPVRQLNKRGCDTKACLTHGDCTNADASNVACYRRQCFATSTGLAQILGLSPHQYRVGFQSRLGRTPWITPYTDHLLTELASQGVKRIAVLCPSFVVDCLETLEEIGIRARRQWQQLGGTHFTLIPCLNNHPTWISGLCDMVRQIGQ